MSGRTKHADIHALTSGYRIVVTMGIGGKSKNLFFTSNDPSTFTLPCSAIVPTDSVGMFKRSFSLHTSLFSVRTPLTIITIPLPTIRFGLSGILYICGCNPGTKNMGRIE